MTSRTPDIAVGTVIHGGTVASGTAISPDLFGAFFEDPSHAADGGLYAELIQNRSFAYSRADRLDWHALTAWEVLEREGAAGAVAVSAEAPLHPANPQHAVLHTTATGTAASAPGCATRASTASPSRKVHTTTSVSTPGPSDGTAVRLVAVTRAVTANGHTQRGVGSGRRILEAACERADLRRYGPGRPVHSHVDQCRHRPSEPGLPLPPGDVLGLTGRTARRPGRGYR
ncbi:hypothetical protein UK15_32235 [Streptomyces variegatus]|uniref:Uncharacterized protein n=1 Tax=Streptomyces variegatus TaxID=284040 RepID=A0A0M2GDY4_9ACTN|nr:hypothetical protein UK15_32235 [Streptomyces variegatus]